MSLERIDSGSNKKLKLIGKLHTRKYRQQENLFVAEGIRLVEMAAESDWKISFVLVTESAQSEPRVQQILEKLAEKRCPVYLTTDELYKKAADTVSPQGLLAVIEPGLAQLSDLLQKDRPLIAVLDGVQDPGNAGTIIRTADAAGFDGVVCLENTVDVLSDKTVRSSMGSLFNIPVAVGVKSKSLLEICNKKALPVMVTALDNTAISHFEADYNNGGAIVFGNEGNGASKEMLSSANQKIYIPMAGKAESLNVAVAAAIVIYEAYRQKMK